MDDFIGAVSMDCMAHRARDAVASGGCDAMQAGVDEALMSLSMLFQVKCVLM